MYDFEDLLQSSVRSFCVQYGYQEPGVAWQEKLRRRLPPGLCKLFSHGLDEGLLQMVDEFRFTMQDLPTGKGPYALFSRSSSQLPIVNWEYVVQAVDYVRVHDLLSSRGYVIGVEDKLMDVTVRDRDGTLLWYIESKESSDGLKKLLDEIRNWGQLGVDFETNDRHKDGLRKSKYLVQHRPQYFSGSAIGIRLDFSVDYGENNRFRLDEDVIPLA